MKSKSDLSRRLRDANKNANNKMQTLNKEDTELIKQRQHKEMNVKKFLRWLMFHGAIQILVGVISSWLTIKLPSVSIVGLLIFRYCSYLF